MIDLKDKKVALLGFGREAKALLPYLKEKDARVSICDKNKRIAKFDNEIEYYLGDDYLNNLDRFDIVFRSPGIPFKTPEIQEAKKQGVEVSSATKLFFEESPAKIIGVTGTKGKGTTSSLIFEVLNKAKTQGRFKGNVYLVGNIGVPAVQILDKLAPEDWVIYELSSFQLQDLNKSPHIAVVLSITSDHLDYHQTQGEYIKAKQSIVRYQTTSDYAVINADSVQAQKISAITKSQIYAFSKEDENVERGVVIVDEDVFFKSKSTKEKICSLRDVNLRGGFNLSNVAAACVASYVAGVDLESIRLAMREFKGLPHRLEFVDKIDGIEYYNDSYSTVPDAAEAAVLSFDKPVTLIVGGSSKGANLDRLTQSVVRSCVENVVYIGQEGERIKTALQNFNFTGTMKKGEGSMAAIVEQARSLTQTGGVVLLSPAAASFDMFKNADERGEKFKQAVQSVMTSNN